MLVTKLNPLRCCSFMYILRQQKAAALPEPVCCRELSCPSPAGELLWSEIHPAKQKCSCSNPFASTHCCHATLPTWAFEKHQRKLHTPCLGRSQHSLAFSTEDPAAYHKSWKVPAFLHKNPICGQKLKGSGSYLATCYLREGKKEQQQQQKRTANYSSRRHSKPTTHLWLLITLKPTTML